MTSSSTPASPHSFDWSKVFTGELEKFRLALALTEDLAEARKIAKEPIRKLTADDHRVWG
tara:strand:- start:19 stop:198 length:180 start_codon:yes stop_codon:yes gene_type:complete